MVTPALIGGPQKPRPKIADLPDDARRVMRCIIRHCTKQSLGCKDLGVSIDEFALGIEELIDKGAVKIVTDRSPAAAHRTGGSNYKIVPTGKY